MKEYPVFLIMTGLYQTIYAMQNDPALTFLLRSPKEMTGALSLLQIRNQYRDVFAIGDTEAQDMAELTKGYAFAFQALGTAYWDYRDSKDILAAVQKLDEMLDTFVYRKIWESLSGKERDILVAMDEGDVKVEDVRKRTNMTSGVFSQYRERLIAKGIMSAPRYGYVRLTLPRISEIAKSYV